MRNRQACCEMKQLKPSYWTYQCHRWEKLNQNSGLNVCMRRSVHTSQRCGHFPVASAPLCIMGMAFCTERVDFLFRSFGTMDWACHDQLHNLNGSTNRRMSKVRCRSLGDKVCHDTRKRRMMKMQKEGKVLHDIPRLFIELTLSSTGF